MLEALAGATADEAVVIVVRDEAGEEQGSQRLPRVPALDGLRGLGVAAVVAFHLGRLDGGFLGVDLFFVLSGFLITSLLVGESTRTSTIDLGRFWARRARRLLPALLVTLVGVGLLLLWLTPEAQRAGFRGDALATLGYVANWHRMTDNLGYWDLFSQPSPLDHTWSLAIEEQFYVLWPLVVLAVLRLARRRPPGPLLAGVAVGGAVASLGLLALTYDRHDTNRAYFGTDTRIAATLLGAALAAFCVGRARPASARPWLVQGAAMLGLGWIGWSFVTVDGVHSWYYGGGLASVVLATLVVIYAVTGPPGPLARALSWAPLRALGIVSYGVYLWHWPIIVFLTGERAHVEGVALDLLQVAVTLAAAGASYVLVERPIRHGALSGWRIRLATPVALAASILVVVVATSGTRAPAGPVARPKGELKGIDSSTLYVPEGAAGTTRRVLLVGDSGTSVLGPELVDATAGSDTAVAWSSEPFCTPVYTSPNGLLMPEETLWERAYCPERRIGLWTDLVEQFDPDVVLYYLANAGTTAKEMVDGEWVWDCDEPYDDYLRTTLGGDVDMLAAGGATVVVATSPYVTSTEPTSHDRVDCRNETYRQVAEDRPGTEVVDLNGWVADATERAGHGLMVDNLHLTDEAAADAAGWLLPQLPEVDADADESAGDQAPPATDPGAEPDQLVPDVPPLLEGLPEGDLQVVVPVMGPDIGSMPPGWVDDLIPGVPDLGIDPAGPHPDIPPGYPGMDGVPPLPGVVPALGVP